MSIKIIQPRRTIETVTHYLAYSIGNDGCGYSFPCDESGVIFPLDNEAAKDNFKRCLSGEDGITFDGLKTHTNSYRAPAEALCTCGRTVYLDDPLDNECECGKCYNMSGQQVTPSWQCDEQGNPYEDN